MGSRYACIALDHGCHHAADGFESQGERCHVYEANVCEARARFSGENGALDGGTGGDSLISVDLLVRFFVELFF